MRGLDALLLPLMVIMMMFMFSLRRNALENEGTEQNDNVAGKETNRKLPIIFIGGTPRSGSTLLRAMLDSHSMVRCGRDSILLPILLARYRTMKTDPMEVKFMQMFKLDDELMERSYAGLVYELVVRHGEQAQRYCKKDNYLIQHAPVLLKLFPRAKFIFMIRDGRAVVDSLVRRKPLDGTKVSGTNYTENLANWDVEEAKEYEGCRTVGPDKCFPIYYEQLIQKPKETLESLIYFLDLPWEDSILEHKQKIGTEVDLSPREKEADQVTQSLYLDARGRWYDEAKFPEERLKRTLEIAPMLKKLGYSRFVLEGRTYNDLNQNNYGCSQNMCRNGEFWTDDAFDS